MPKPDARHPHAEEVRLQAFLAHSGVASRRAAEELIASGRVFVNGTSVTAPGTKIRPGVDRVEVEGQPVEVQPVTWIALHKPRGYVTTRLDPYGRKTVYELIPEKYHGLFHVGRLDRDSEGLLLLTNDGALANRMLHPSYGVTKEYWADVEGKPTAEEMHRLTEGVEDEGDFMQAESVRRLHQTGENQHRLSVVMREGKKREVRRMLEALGHPVARLIRRRFGPVSLGELKPGKWRVVADSELAALRQPGRRSAATSHRHTGEAEAESVGGERRPQRKPKDSRANGIRGNDGPKSAFADSHPPRRAPEKAKKSAAAPSRERPSELRARARDEARRHPDDGKPRRAAQERDERPYQERRGPGPVKRGAAKRGPVRRDRDDAAAFDRGPMRRGPVKRGSGEAGEDRAPVRRGPVKRGSADAGEDRAPVRRGPVKRGSSPSKSAWTRDEERGPSPRDASRGFPKSRPGGKGSGPKTGRGAAGEREMETPYPSTRRGSARPSPRGGAADARREDRDAPRGKGGGPGRGPGAKPGGGARGPAGPKGRGGPPGRKGGPPRGRR
jgi:pseudouridine synthase